jgi:hypothetical protein
MIGTKEPGALQISQHARFICALAFDLHKGREENVEKYQIYPVIFSCVPGFGLL